MNAKLNAAEIRTKEETFHQLEAEGKTLTDRYVQLKAEIHAQKNNRRAIADLANANGAKIEGMRTKFAMEQVKIDEARAQSSSSKCTTASAQAKKIQSAASAAKKTVETHFDALKGLVQIAVRRLHWKHREEVDLVEKIKSELETTNSVMPDGSALLDFPRKSQCTLSEATAFEFLDEVPISVSTVQCDLESPVIIAPNVIGHALHLE
jgi:predicted  nucleic acid-binding Zn-ribbon protein